ncbi:MAG: DNA repair exonuclease [Armatimonadetes bacterium]|nr:DNA repair exonuclease [Armatimonadota bacterium]
MASVKFVHIADSHLSRPFGFLPPALAEERRRDQRQTLTRVVDLALERDVDLFLVSGDLFDRPDPDPTDVEAVTAGIGRLLEAGKRVFAIPGNHDFCTSNSFWHRLDAPGLRIFLEPECEHVVLDDLGVAVAGSAFDRSQSERRAFDRIELPKDAPCILLLHASLESFGVQLERYHPFSLAELESCGAAYVALGHYHRLNTVASDGVTACYPGSFEGLGFDGPETDDRHIVFGEIAEDGKAAVEPVKVNRRTMRAAELDCTSFETQAGLDEAVRRLCDADALLSLKLTGAPIQDLLASIEEIPARFRESVAHMEVDSSALSGAPDLCLDNSIRGRFCKHLLDRIEASADTDTTRLLRRALDLGLSALSDG